MADNQDQQAEYGMMDRAEALDIIKECRWEDEDAWASTWDDKRENPFFQTVIPLSEVGALASAERIAEALRFFKVDAVGIVGPLDASHEHNYEQESVYYVMCHKFTFRDRLPELIHRDYSNHYPSM